MTKDVDGVQVTKKVFGRTDGRADRGNHNIPELSLESAGKRLRHQGVFESI